MTRNQRRSHLAVWIALVPLLAAVLLAALRQAEMDDRVRANDAAYEEPSEVSP